MTCWGGEFGSHAQYPMNSQIPSSALNCELLGEETGLRPLESDFPSSEGPYQTFPTEKFPKASFSSLPQTSYPLPSDVPDLALTQCALHLGHLNWGGPRGSPRETRSM